MPHTLTIENLHVSIANTPIVKGVDLAIRAGEVHSLMGPNGSGKSTLAGAIMGHPKHIITHGRILLDSEDITSLSPDKRAKKGLFLSLQYPPSISGVSIAQFLHAAVNAKRQQPMPLFDFEDLIKKTMAILDMDPSFTERSVNEGFSGGEKKRAEILQLMVLQPTFAILDETDSGLDVDALKIVAAGISQVRSPDRGFLIITHYSRILDYLTPDFVHIMEGGIITRSGGPELAREIDQKGYR